MDIGPPFTIVSTCKGGGYRYARTNPLHPRRNSKGLYPLHIVLMENKLGRLLRTNEVVHHHDENKANDDISNLRLKTRSGHSREHAVERSPGDVECVCAVCEKPFTLKHATWRLRLNRNATNEVTCSRSCGAMLGHRQKSRDTAANQE